MKIMDKVPAIFVSAFVIGGIAIIGWTIFSSERADTVVSVKGQSCRRRRRPARQRSMRPALSATVLTPPDLTRGRLWYMTFTIPAIMQTMRSCSRPSGACGNIIGRSVTCRRSHR